MQIINHQIEMLLNICLNFLFVSKSGYIFYIHVIYHDNVFLNVVLKFQLVQISSYKFYIHVVCHQNEFSKCPFKFLDGLTSSCIFYIFSSPFVQNFFSQILHSYGLSPECIFKCSFKLPARAKFLSQSLH